MFRGQKGRAGLGRYPRKQSPEFMNADKIKLFAGQVIKSLSSPEEENPDRS